MGYSMLCKVSTVVIIVSIICISALLLYFLGIQKDLTWNNNAVRTSCNILNHNIEKQICWHAKVCPTSTESYTTMAESYQTTTKLYQSCYSNCYDGYIKVEYVINEKKYDKLFQIYYKSDYFIYVSNGLDNNYPINSDITCYYNKYDHNDAGLSLIDITVNLVFFIIICCIAGSILIGSIILFIKMKYQ